MDHVHLMVAAQALVGQFLATFVEFPPRQKAASFTIDQVLAKMEAAITGGQWDCGGRSTTASSADRIPRGTRTRSAKIDGIEATLKPA